MRAPALKLKFDPLNTNPVPVALVFAKLIEPVVSVRLFVLVVRFCPLKTRLLPVVAGPEPLVVDQLAAVFQRLFVPLPVQVNGAAEATPPKALQAIASNATDGIPFNRVNTEENFIIF